jgi:glycosyltransferase involved in cell wall biosynthesis
MPFRPAVSMLGWALNEEASLEDYVARAEAFLRGMSDDFELVLIDDGSTDRTWELACSLGPARPWLRLLKNEVNRGSGFCYRRAIGAASKDYFLVQTVDWSYDISAIGQSVGLLNEYDVLQGTRAAVFSRDGMLRRSDNLFKSIVSSVNYLLIRLLFRAPFSDYQNITMCPTRLVQSLTLEADSSFANPEVMLKLWWRGSSFKELPVPFVRRVRGRGTGTRWTSIVKSITEIMRYWFRWVVLGRRQHRGRGRIMRLESRAW